MSGLNHFTLAHSGLRGSLHTLDGLPYVGPPKCSLRHGRDSFDDGTFTRKVWRPCHGAPMIFLSVITLPVSIVSFTLPPFAMCSGWRESGCRRGVGSATASAPSSPGIAQAQGAVAPWDRGHGKRRRQIGSNLGDHEGRQFLPPSWGGTCLPLSAVVPVGRNTAA